MHKTKTDFSSVRCQYMIGPGSGSSRRPSAYSESLNYCPRSGVLIRRSAGIGPASLGVPGPGWPSTAACNELLFRKTVWSNSELLRRGRRPRRQLQRLVGANFFPEKNYGEKNFFTMKRSQATLPVDSWQSRQVTSPSNRSLH